MNKLPVITKLYSPIWTHQLWLENLFHYIVQFTRNNLPRKVLTLC